MPEKPLIDETLAEVLVNGPPPHLGDPQRVPPGLPARFEARAAELRAVLGDRARLVEHIGSTAVPGLAAKPTIDILVGIDDPDDEPAYLRDLLAAGCGSANRGTGACASATRTSRSTCTATHPTTPRPASASSSATGCAPTRRTVAATRRPSARWPTASGAT